MLAQMTIVVGGWSGTLHESRALLSLGRGQGDMARIAVERCAQLEAVGGHLLQNAREMVEVRVR